MRILIIDDSSDFRELLSRHILSNYPETDIVAYDPVKEEFSYKNLNIHGFSLVFLDYDLGIIDRDGLGYLKYLKSKENIPPIIMLTAADNTRVAVRALKLGATDYLLKRDSDEQIIGKKISEVMEFTHTKQDLQPNTLNNSSIKSLLKETNEKEAEYDTSSDLLFSDEKIKTENGTEIIVPGYDIIHEIGRGGMSTVLLARRHEDNKDVVLKVLFTKEQEDPLALKRFMQEYTLISCLDNPHVIKIYERAFASNFAYIAMEYFPNGDLTHRIETGIKTEQAIDYLRQMATGMQAVHDINVVHRDLKPGNILFRDDNSLTIADFGAAKNISGDMEDITINNMVVGTPYYMSPEQATGIKVDKRSDIYSLGVMFFQMLTGHRPFNGNTVSQLIYSHLNDPAPDLPTHLSRYQPLIHGLLAKDPDERFQDANDIIVGLEWL